MKKFFIWEAKSFYTINELYSYIELIKKSIVGKTIDKIMVMEPLYTCSGYDDNGNRCVKYSSEDEWFIEKSHCENTIQSIPTHQVVLGLDEPLVFCFGNEQFEIKYCEFSNAQVAMNTLDFTERSTVEGCVAWQNVNKYFVKNIIGQKLVDIKIKYTPKPNEFVSHYRRFGEKMYDEIIFVFENGYQLEIVSDNDYMILSEKHEWQKLQAFSEYNWNFYSKSNIEGKKPSFKKLVKSSKPIKLHNINVLVETSCGIDLDIIFEANNIKSQIWIAESVNYVPNILRFLEAIVYSKSKECFYFFEEEGPETFLYTKNLSDNKIRFIHLSSRIQFQRRIQSEEYKIRLDVIIDKKEFVRTLYNSIMNEVNKISKKEILEEWEYQIDAFEVLKRGSQIIEKYIEDNS